MQTPTLSFGHERTEFVGVDFDVASPAEVLNWLTQRNEHSPYGYIVTPNVDHVVRLAGAPGELYRAYTESDKCVCDSRVLRFIGRMFGVHLTLVTGSDLTAELFDRILQPGEKVAIVGSTHSTIISLRTKYPQFVIAHHDAPMRFLENIEAHTAAIAFVRDERPRFTLLAVGSPQQELLAYEMKLDGLVTGTALCIGASIDFIVGVQRRAPRFLQRSGLEWAWRLITQPRRLAYRYLVSCPAIFPLVLSWWKKTRISR